MFNKNKINSFYSMNSDSYLKSSSKIKNIKRRQIRILSGTYRRQLINTPWSSSCRPTLSRCRQSLFDYICHSSGKIKDLHNLSVIDLYAGSASLALESISRGAKMAICVEHDHECCNIIRENFQKLDCLDKLQLHRAKVAEWLQKEPVQLDIIYADPPYISRYELNEWANHLLPINILPWLSENGIYVLQHHKNVEPPAESKELCQVKSLNQGATTFTIYQKNKLVPGRN